MPKPFDQRPFLAAEFLAPDAPPVPAKLAGRLGPGEWIRVPT